MKNHLILPVEHSYNENLVIVENLIPIKDTVALYDDPNRSTIYRKMENGNFKKVRCYQQSNKGKAIESAKNGVSSYWTK